MMQKEEEGACARVVGTAHCLSALHKKQHANRT